MICHNCQDKELAQYECNLIRSLLRTKSPAIALDVGCGDSKDGERIFTDSQYVGVDMTNGVDARLLPFDDNHFDFVLMKRILCQNDESDRKRIVQEATRVCSKNGRLIVCEPWLTEYGNMNRLRALSGLEPLPKPASGGRLLENREFYGLTEVHDVAVAPGYVYWTRYMFELLTGRQASYDEPIVRCCYPYTSQETEKVAFYRVKIYEKP